MTAPATENKKKSFWARWLGLLTTEFFILLVLLFASVTVFVYAVNMVFIKKTTDFDENVFTYISQHVQPMLTSFMVFISKLGRHTFLIPANLVLIAFYLFVRKNRRLSVRISSMALTSLSIMFMLKLSFQRSRPEIPLLEKVSGFSFPSGHALMSVTFYGLLIYIVWKEIKYAWLRYTITALLLILILLIGISRIYLRVHYASDVMAGFAVGLAWLLLATWAINKIEQKRFARKTIASQPPV